MWSTVAAVSVPVPSVIMARSAMTLRHKANNICSKITRPVLLDKSQLIAAFVICGRFFQNSNYSQYHERLSKYENRPDRINLVKKSCPKAGTERSQI